MDFKLKSKLTPTGDQPKAIKELVKNVKSGIPRQTLLGVTGSGKTFTMSNVIAQTQKPTLIISPNKTLAAQLYQEFKEFFPNNAVHYFVSYYDYYQPEAYIPQSDTYIEKDAKINETLDRLRHEAAQDVLSQKDVIVIASVSCIYNIGSPEEYQSATLHIKEGQEISRRDFLSNLTSLQYVRNDIDFKPGTFRVRGDIVEIFVVTGKEIVRVEFSSNTIYEISTTTDTLTPSYKKYVGMYNLYPAKFWITSEEKQKIALRNIKTELSERVAKLKKAGKNLEAERLTQRTNYDIEMIEESGYCHGIENYSSHMEFRKPGEPPFSLVDYFGKDSLIFIDESHLTLPQIRAMSAGDRARKQSLINFGFRLPSAVDNRPLTINEFFKRAPQIIYVSATPGELEEEESKSHVAQQLIRPTGLLEPSIKIRPTDSQIQDLIKEIKKSVVKKERTLVITLTKRLSEDITEYLTNEGINVQWLHSEIKTLERPVILEDFRRGTYDVLVGINLLREGLDLPEVALIAILDADKEGFLRNETTLIQTMGRAARHINGRVILYADSITGSMRSAMKEVTRRRKIQEDYNKKHNITPSPITKEITSWSLTSKEEIVTTEWGEVQDKKALEKEMRQAASNLDFERATILRDLIKNIKDDTTVEYGNNKFSKKGSPPVRKTKSTQLKNQA